ncbi:hypothetical protein, partial [Agathobaculum sp.]|uniref:hypothetical protein n=1 Tax=Agathobaculum sp. TaxID=2048138 RepID=UPI003FD88F92
LGVKRPQVQVLSLGPNKAVLSRERAAFLLLQGLFNSFLKGLLISGQVFSPGSRGADGRRLHAFAFYGILFTKR